MVKSILKNKVRKIEFIVWEQPSRGLLFDQPSDETKLRRHMASDASPRIKASKNPGPTARGFLRPLITVQTRFEKRRTHNENRGLQSTPLVRSSRGEIKTQWKRLHRIRQNPKPFVNGKNQKLQQKTCRHALSASGQITCHRQCHFGVMGKNRG